MNNTVDDFFLEQYDTFVKFTHDQLMRRFGEQPASCKFYFTPFVLPCPERFTEASF